MKYSLFLLLFLISAPVLRAENLRLEVYRQNGWADQYKPIDGYPVSLSAAEEIGAADLLMRIDALRVRVDRRAGGHQFWLELTEESEEAASDAGVRFELVRFGRRYAFDLWGKFVIDRRFILSEDEELIAGFETFYRNCFVRTPLGEEKAYAVKEREPVEPEVSLPIFSGFEDDYYQQHDALILKLVKEFNANPAAWAGAAEGATVVIPPLRPELIKSLMIEESGGKGKRSRAAWARDPLQVNVPGDWTPEKRDLGLHKPANRNEGTLEGNVRAGIKYLVRKGFGVSGQPIAKRPDAYFDSWRVALMRYNGRKERIRDGRSYRVAYADRIIRRSSRPARFVPIAVDRRSVFRER